MAKYIKHLAVFCLVLSLLAQGVPGAGASAASQPVTLTVEAPAQTHNSSTVTVICRLRVPENTRVDGLNAALSFDPNAFALGDENLIPGALLQGAALSRKDGKITLLYEKLGAGIGAGEHILFTAVFDIRTGQKEQEALFAITAQECYQGILEDGVFQGFRDLPTQAYSADVFLGERFAPSAHRLQLTVGAAAALTFNKPIQSWQNHNPDLVSFDLETGEVRAIKPGLGAITFLSAAYEQCTVVVEIAEKPPALEHISSSVYHVSGDRISKIPQQTTAADFLSRINEKEYAAVYTENGKPAANTDYLGTGFTVKLMDGTKVVRSYQVCVTGDVNGDGKITAADYVNVKFRVLDKITLSGVYSAAADVNGDGKITASDYVNIKFDVLNKSSITPR